MLDIENLEHRARERLSATIYDYFAGGADDETTRADNPAAWKRIRLVPRVMRDVSAVSIAAEVLGTPLTMPIMVGPWAFQGLAHAEGERATARGAAAAGTSDGGVHHGHDLARGCRRRPPPDRRCGSSSTCCATGR